eukprot:3434042-Prorocentrum_lima.AAC.1
MRSRRFKALGMRPSSRSIGKLCMMPFQSLRRRFTRFPARRSQDMENFLSMSGLLSQTRAYCPRRPGGGRS